MGDTGLHTFLSVLNQLFVRNLGWISMELSILNKRCFLKELAIRMLMLIIGEPTA